LGIVGQNIGAQRAKKMDGLARNRKDIRKEFAQGAMNASQKVSALRADVILRCAQLQREQSSHGQMFAGGPKELGSVEAVQLRGLRVGQIENDRVKLVASRSEIEPAVGVMNMHSIIRNKRSRRRGKQPLRHVDDRGIELNIVHPLDRGML